MTSSLPSAKAQTSVQGITVCLEQQELAQTDGEMMRDSAINRTVLSRPHAWCYQVRIDADAPVTFDLSIRMPGWMVGLLEVTVDGEKADYTTDEHGFAHVVRTWHKQAVTIRIGKHLSCYPLPDDPDMVAFMDGPICLAGLVSEEHLLYGDKENPEDSLLCASDERQWQSWRPRWKTYHQPFGIEFRPLYGIGHEAYTVYFPVVKK